MKKGAVHLDWMISMGIFIMFLLSMLVFFKPGAESAYGRDYLISILEDNFKSSTFYSIERIPININGLDINDADKIEYVNLKFDGNFPICDENMKTFNVVDELLEDVDFEISDFDCTDGERDGNIEIKPYLIDGSNTFKVYLLYNADEFSKYNSVSIECLTTPQEGNPVNCVDAPKEKINVGVSEIVSGLNQKKLDLINQEINQETDNIYDKDNGIKSRWKYPKTKDFKICIDGMDDANCFPHDNIRKIPGDANVFVKEFKENVLNENTGLGTGVVVNIRAW